MIEDDGTLLARLADGDERAFNILFERYRARLYNYLLKITKSPEISEEIIIDIFVKLWVGRKVMDQVQNLGSFLHKVVYHKAIDFLRTTARHTRLQNAYIARIKSEPEKLPDELLIDAEFRQILRKAIYQLPPKRRLIYTLSREQGLTHDEIARTLNLSRNTVKNSIVAATKSISEYLQDNSSNKAVFPLLFFLV